MVQTPTSRLESIGRKDGVAQWLLPQAIQPSYVQLKQLNAVQLLLMSVSLKHC